MPEKEEEGEIEAEEGEELSMRRRHPVAFAVHPYMAWH